MIGKTNKMRRRLSVVALAVSIAAVAIPAASAGDKYFGPGSNRVEKQGPYGAYWVQQIRVLGPGSSTVEKRGPYGAYWVRDNAQSKNTLVDSSSVVDRLLGSPDPRDSMASVVTNNGVSSEIYEEAGQEHGSNGFLGRTTTLRLIIQDAAKEHGAAGFGNVSAS